MEMSPLIWIRVKILCSSTTTSSRWLFLQTACQIDLLSKWWLQITAGFSNNLRVTLFKILLPGLPKWISLNLQKTWRPLVSVRPWTPTFHPTQWCPWPSRWTNLRCFLKPSKWIRLHRTPPRSKSMWCSSLLRWKPPGEIKIWSRKRLRGSTWLS